MNGRRRNDWLGTAPAVPVLVLVGCALLTGCGVEREADEVAETESVTVAVEGENRERVRVSEAPADAEGVEGRAVRAERRDLRVTLDAPGQVVAPPTEYAEIRSPYTAPIDRVFATVGHPVEDGDVIVQLSYPSAEAYYREAQTALRAARDDFEAAEGRYDRYVDLYTDRLARARNQVDEARRRYLDLEAGEPDSPELTTTSTALQLAIAERRSAEASVAEARDYRDSQLQLYRERLAAARAALDQAEAGVKQALIRSPIDGQVISVAAAPNETAQAGETVAVVADLSDLHVQLPLTARQAAVVERGMNVVFNADTVPDEPFRGQVRDVRVNYEAEPGGGSDVDSYVAIVGFRNTRGEAKPGMDVSARISLGTAEDALVVPDEAIDLNEQGERIVRVQRGQAWEPVVVELGVSDDDYTEVRRGLNDGDVVLATPPFRT